jgi:hypothetical protein
MLADGLTMPFDEGVLLHSHSSATNAASNSSEYQPKAPITTAITMAVAVRPRTAATHPNSAA